MLRKERTATFMSTVTEMNAILMSIAIPTSMGTTMTIRK